jgi:5-methylthioribose kinase
MVVNVCRKRKLKVYHRLTFKSIWKLQINVVYENKKKHRVSKQGDIFLEIIKYAGVIKRTLL